MVAEAVGSNRIQTWRQEGKKRRTCKCGRQEIRRIQETGRRVEQEQEEARITKAFLMRVKAH